MASFFVEYDMAEKAMRERKDLKRLKLLSEVKAFAKSCTYTRRKHATDVIYYWTKESKDVAVLTGLKDGDIRGIKTQVSKQLFEIFGRDFFDKICNGSDEDFMDCHFKFKSVTNTKDAYYFFPREYIDIIREDDVSIKEFDVKDCAEEYKFLKSFCMQNFRGKIRTLDKDKLCFLLNILEGKAGSPRDRYGMSKRLAELEE